MTSAAVSAGAPSLRRRVSEALTASSAAMVYGVMRLGMPRVFAHHSLPHLLATLSGPRAPRAPGGVPDGAGHAIEDLAMLERALHVVDGALARLSPVPNTCLYRSLCRYALYRHGQLPVTFVMGVAVDGTSPAGHAGERAADLEAHAWLELGGAVFGEALERPYRKTFEYPFPGDLA